MVGLVVAEDTPIEVTVEAAPKLAPVIIMDETRALA